MNADDFLVRLGLVIRGHRQALNISQETFADRIGTNRAYYGDVERGTRNLTMRSLHRIARGLGTQVWDLFLEVKALRIPSGAQQPIGRSRKKQGV